MLQPFYLNKNVQMRGKFVLMLDHIWAIHFLLQTAGSTLAGLWLVLQSNVFIHELQNQQLSIITEHKHS